MTRPAAPPTGAFDAERARREQARRSEKRRGLLKVILIVLAVLLAIRDVKIHPFLEAMGALPTGLGETIVAALAADPESRVESADLFRQQLASYRRAADDGLRKELATLVSGALAAAEGIAAVDRETVVGEEPVTPARPGGGEVIGETTGKVPELPYEIRTQSGQPLGRFSFAQVIEMVATGRVGARDLVRFGGGPETRIVDVPELAAHVPPLSLE